MSKMSLDGALAGHLHPHPELRSVSFDRLRMRERFQLRGREVQDGQEKQWFYKNLFPAL